MKVTRFHHVSVNSNGTPLDEMVGFYRDVLGLGDQPRPEIPGIAGPLARGGRPGAAPGRRAAVGAGIDPTGHHYCVAVDDLDGAIAELEARGIEYDAASAGRRHGPDLDRRPGRQHDRAPTRDARR